MHFENWGNVSQPRIMKQRKCLVVVGYNNGYYSYVIIAMFKFNLGYYKSEQSCIGSVKCIIFQFQFGI